MVTQNDWFRRYVRETDFLQSYPFYAGVLAQLEFVSTDQVPIMGVRWTGASHQLLVHEPFFDQHPRFRAGVLLHEVHHLVLGHLARRCYFDVQRPDLMQLAMEVSANEYIAEPLPSPIVWQQYQRQGLAPHQSTMDRYQHLLDYVGSIGGGEFALPAGFDHHGDGNAPRRADGRGSIGIADVLHGHALPAGAAAELQAILRRASAIGAQASTATRQEPAQRVDQALQVRRRFERRAANGLLGREVDAAIEELAPAPGPGRVDWRRALRAFVGHEPRADWNRPNRRQPHRLLEVPGRSWHGSRPELLVAIDSSGSMGSGELALIARELQALAAATRITIVECDDTVQRIYPFAGRLDRVQGRGGTDLRPPFAADLLRRHGRDGIVYFTDGQGPVPSTAPTVPVLWVLTGGEPFACPFGRRVLLEPLALPDAGGWDLPF